MIYTAISEKIIEIAKILAERRGLPIGEITNLVAMRLLTNSKENVLKDLQKELLNYSLVVIGRKFCSACEDIKKSLQPGDLYIDADLIIEILPEKIPRKEAIFPIIFYAGEFVFDGIDISKLNNFIQEKKDV